MNGDGIVPPQGLNVINEKKTIYGLPQKIPCGGGGTTITVKPPTPVKAGSGEQIKITAGTYSPAEIPPISTKSQTFKTGSGCRVVVMSSADRTIKSGGSGTKVTILTPLKIRMGGGMKAAKTSA